MPDVVIDGGTDPVVLASRCWSYNYKGPRNAAAYSIPRGYYLMGDVENPPLTPGGTDNTFVMCHFRLWEVYTTGDEPELTLLDEVTHYSREATMEWLFTMARALPTHPFTVVFHNADYDCAVLQVGEQASCETYSYHVDFERSLLSPGRRGPYKVDVLHRWGKRQRRVTFWSTTNWYTTSIKALGESGFGPGLKGSLQDVERLWREAGDRGPMEEYCRRDVLIMEDAFFAFHRFCSSNYRVRAQLTVAATALHLYKEHHLKAHQEGEHEQEHWRGFIQGNRHRPYVDAAERSSYHGGRTEAFYRGTPPVGTPIVKYDVNSMYPSIMADYTLPYLYKGEVGGAEVGAVARSGRVSARDTLHLAYCTVAIPPEDLYGLDCVKATGDEPRLVFPAGTYDTWLWEPHVQLGLELGLITTIHGGYAYHAAPVMRGYALDLYQRRLEATNPTDRSIIKLLLNSLYGKAAQRAFGDWVPTTSGFVVSDAVLDTVREALEVGFGCFAFDHGGTTYDMAYVDGRYWWYREPEHVTGVGSCYSIAAYITACGRLMLNRYFRQIAALGGHVYYCDTDSLVTDVELPPTEVSSSVMGKLKVEWQGTVEYTDGEPNVEFRAPKDYTIDYQALTKGVAKAQARSGFDNTYETTQFKRHTTLLLSARQAMRAWFSDEAATRHVTKRVVSQNLKRSGHCNTDGFLLPLCL